MCKEVINIENLACLCFVREAILCEIVACNTLLQASATAVLEQLRQEADNDNFNHFRE
jgi:hypothetical protein